MKQSPQAFFPFEPFLQDLREKGLRLGTDSYLQVQALLTWYSKQTSPPSTDQLKVQLRAILVSSQAEAELFDERFEAYLDQMHDVHLVSTSGYLAP